MPIVLRHSAVSSDEIGLHELECLENSDYSCSTPAASRPLHRYGWWCLQDIRSYEIHIRPVAPELESFDTAEGILVTAPDDSRYRAKENMVAEAAWKDARDLSNWKHSMDRVSVTMANWSTVWTECTDVAWWVLEMLRRDNTCSSAASTRETANRDAEHEMQDMRCRTWDAEHEIQNMRCKTWNAEHAM